jgi:hypothetical protein
MVRRKYVHASADSLNHEEIDPVLQFTEIKLRYRENETKKKAGDAFEKSV